MFCRSFSFSLLTLSIHPSRLVFWHSFYISITNLHAHVHITIFASITDRYIKSVRVTKQTSKKRAMKRTKFSLLKKSQFALNFGTRINIIQWPYRKYNFKIRSTRSFWFSNVVLCSYLFFLSFRHESIYIIFQTWRPAFKNWKFTTKFRVFWVCVWLFFDMTENISFLYESFSMRKEKKVNVSVTAS